jgi:hypothetical protein
LGHIVNFDDETTVKVFVDFFDAAHIHQQRSADCNSAQAVVGFNHKAATKFIEKSHWF